MTRLLGFLLAITGALATPLSSLAPRWDTLPTECRFAPDWTLDDILADPESFKRTYITRESKFHTTPNISYHPDTGMGYDTREILLDTGLLNTSTSHYNGASSKEAQMFSMYALALSGNEYAKLWANADNPDGAQDLIMSILELKLRTYATFNETYPGFGGMFPWYANTPPLRPDNGWTDQIPALDNG